MANKPVKEKKKFLKNFKAELKKVIWPTPKQVVNNTVVVVTVVLITATIVFVLDFAFEKLNTYGIDKLKETVYKEDNTIDDSDVDVINVDGNNITTDETGNTVEGENVATEEIENVAQNNNETTEEPLAEK